MSALFALALVCAQPPSDAPVPDRTVEGPAAPAPAPAPAPVEITPPAPALAPVEITPPAPAPAPAPAEDPPPPSFTPPSEDSPIHPPPVAQPVAQAPEPEEPEDDPYPLRDAADMPYGATAARKSAVRRNNAMLVRPFRRPTYSVTAYGRFGMLLSGGRDVIQPYGYGFAAALRMYFLPVVKSRFGVEIHAGHTRYPERQEFETIDGEATITRASLLTATDFSAGPSFEIPLGPVFIQVGGSAGVALSTLYRPISSDATEDLLVSTSNFMLRGGLAVGVPIFNQHGLSIGGAVHHIFSPREVPLDPLMPDGPTTLPFGTSLEVALGYQIWF